eukprot:GHUV01043820.1.p2 GENE.GHUV01043820.1~~GHUV01043820.1.p2  ORF type:complete len:120 (-),score=36.40 GHUV01043820.1:42-401(-)
MPVMYVVQAAPVSSIWHKLCGALRSAGMHQSQRTDELPRGHLVSSVSWPANANLVLVCCCRWDQQGGCNMQVMSLSERGGGGGGRQDRRVTFSMIENEGIGMSGQAEWVMVRQAAAVLT